MFGFDQSVCWWSLSAPTPSFLLRPVRTRRPLSLEWKLPIVMTAGIAASLAVLLLCAYVVLRGRAEVIWRDRLSHSVQEIARSIDVSVAQRRAALGAIARDESVRRVLLAGQQPAITARDIDAARVVLSRATTPADTTHPVELWDTQGRRIAVAGPEFPVADRFARIISGLESTRDTTSDSVRFSPLEAIGNRVRFWAVAPVIANGTRVGFIVQPRYIAGQREQLRTLRELIREDVGLFLRNADGSVWVTAPDAPTPPPLRRDSSSAGIVNVRSGTGRMLTQEAFIGGTPWVAVLEASEHSIMGPRVYRTIRLLAGLSVLVVVIGGLLSWVVGHQKRFVAVWTAQ